MNTKKHLWKIFLSVIILWAMAFLGGTVILRLLRLFTPQGFFDISPIVDLIISVAGAAVGVLIGNDLIDKLLHNEGCALFKILNNAVLAASLVTFALITLYMGNLTLILGLQIGLCALTCVSYCIKYRKELKQ